MGKTEDLKEQSQIVTSLKFYIYYSEGLSIICHQHQITDICIKSMNYFLEKSENQHKSEESDYYGEEDQLENYARGDATPIRGGFYEKVYSFKIVLK